MLHHSDTDPRRPALLRRTDRYALLAFLSRKHRAARLCWGKKRYPGHIRAWPRTGAISFRTDGGAAASLGLPEEGTSVDVHFRVRGLSFHAEGLVRQVQRDQGRLLLVPDLVEWSAQRIVIEGGPKLRAQAALHLRSGDEVGREVAVVTLREGSIDFVCWPCPNQSDGQVRTKGRLLLPGRKRIELDLIVEKSTQVYPGCTGRLLRAFVQGQPQPYIAALAELSEHAPDELTSP
jgi:hypothetical protein